MSKNTSTRAPKYCRHAATGRGIVRLNGRMIYLPGDYNSPESRAEYGRLVGNYLATGGKTQTDITVNECMVLFLEHADAYYRKPDGAPTSEPKTLRYALKHLREAYGPTPAADFKPADLRVVRERMIAGKWKRRYINQQVVRIRMLFKWLAGQGILDASVYAALACVEPLKAGRCGVEDQAPVRPVDADVLNASRPHMNPQVRCLVELQLLTAARPGELLTMKMDEIDRSDPACWLYTPVTHKNAYRGQGRQILLGPQSQVWLAPFIREDGGYLFQPAEAEAQRRAALSLKRITPLSCGNKPGSNRRKHAKHRPGEHYSVDSYRRAIQYACDRAGVAPFHPHALRHSAATALAKEHGVEVARLLLGHSSLSTTLLYAENSLEKAKAAAVKSL